MDTVLWCRVLLVAVALGHNAAVALRCYHNYDAKEGKASEIMSEVECDAATSHHMCYVASGGTVLGNTMQLTCGNQYCPIMEDKCLPALATTDSTKCCCTGDLCNDPTDPKGMGFWDKTVDEADRIMPYTTTTTTTTMPTTTSTTTSTTAEASTTGGGNDTTTTMYQRHKSAGTRPATAAVLVVMAAAAAVIRP